MARAVPALICALLGAFALPFAAAGHGAGQPWLLVPADHVEQGQSFTVIGADMGPGVQVTLELAAGGSITSLGTAQAASDGHFESSFVVPSSVPDGYVELRARDTGGLDAATWLLVGDGTEAAAAAPPPGPADAARAWWADPSVLVLGGLLGGAALALLVMLLRSRSRTPARAAVEAHAPRPRPVARKSGPRKSRRAD